jgi:RNA recognition motif-containing protein
MFGTVNRKYILRAGVNARFLSVALQPQYHVFVGNLPLDYSLDTVTGFLKSNKVTGFAGPRLALSPKGKFRGFVFLDFDSIDLAQNAMSLLKDTVADGRPVKADLTDSKDGAKKGRRSGRLNADLQLFIGNIPFKMTKDDLTDIIQDQIGKENHFLVKLHNDGVQSLGYCHVTFSREEDMEVVIRNMHLSELSGRVINVERAVLKNKEEEELPNQNRTLSAEEEEEEKIAQQNMQTEPTEEVRYRPSMERRLAKKNQLAQRANQSPLLVSGRKVSGSFFLLGASSRNREIEVGTAGEGHLALVNRNSEIVHDWRAGVYGDSNRKREAAHASSRPSARVNFASRDRNNRVNPINNGDRTGAPRRSGDEPIARFGGGGKRKGVQSSSGNGAGGGRRY